MKKKVTACLTAIALAGTVAASAAAMAGCSSADLRIMLLTNTAENKFYEKYFKELEEQYGIKIKYNGYSSDDYPDMLDGEMTQGKTPDIFYVRPNEIIKFKDDIQCVEDYVTSNQTAVNFDDVYDLALDMYKYNESTNKMDAENGKLYAFPKDLSTQQMGYNKKVVQQYTSYFTTNNLTLPWDLGKEGKAEAYTWTEYKNLCEYISSNLGQDQKSYIGCDVPDLELIVKSMGGGLLDDELENVTINNDIVKAAIEYQAALCTPSAAGKKAAASRRLATYAGFAAGNVAFYGLCGSWEVGEYNATFNDDGGDNWGVMPTPVNNKGDKWQGTITSAGYVVSKDCAKPDLAKEIAASFMTTKMQTRLMDQGLSLPLLKSFATEYVKEENDDKYAPSTRSVYIDVISGNHGFTPIKYYTLNTTWLEILTNQLDTMYKASNPNSYYDSNINLATLQSQMQSKYNEIKN